MKTLFLVIQSQSVPILCSFLPTRLHEDPELIPVEYRERAAYVSRSMDSEKAVKKLLTTKLLPWEHEREVRVLAYDEFVNVEVKEIVFGKKIEDNDMMLLEQLAKRFGIKNTKKMTNSELKDFA